MQRVVLSPTLHRGVKLTTLPPLALYVHIPWCVRKCPYCDFNSHEAKSDFPEDAYVDALLRDIEQALPQIWGRRIHSVFFGGGTPSLFSASGIDRILAGVRALLPIERCAEITLEANPGTFEVAKFREFAAAGINRLSLGIQSFNDRHLRALGRIHNAGEARRAAESAGLTFDHVNLDLMYGLPGQTESEAIDDITMALSLQPQHLSVYNLTIEANTAFAHAPPTLPDNDACFAMQQAIEVQLHESGFTRYEISAFTRDGKRCRHNLNYWRFGDYLGIGAGAHSKISLPNEIRRSARLKNPRRYLEASRQGETVESSAPVPASDLGFEFMLNALRLVDGVESDLFERTTGLPLIAMQAALDAAERRGLLLRDYRHLAPTALGLRFHNDLLSLFLPESSAQ